MFLTTVLIYSLIGFCQFALRLVFSLDCKSSTEVGGFGIDTERTVSLIQTSSGIFVLIIPSLLTSVIDKKFGLVRSILTMSVLFMILNAALSYSVLLQEYLKFIALVTAFGLSNSLAVILMLYLSICLSNTVELSHLGTAIGVAQAIVGVCRFAATISFGFIYGWSVTDGLTSYGTDAHFSYIVIVIILVINILIIKLKLNKTVEKKKEKPELEILLVCKNEKE